MYFDTNNLTRGRCYRDRIIIEFTPSTCAVDEYHRPWRGAIAGTLCFKVYQWRVAYRCFF